MKYSALWRKILTLIFKAILIAVAGYCAVWVAVHLEGG